MSKFKVGLVGCSQHSFPGDKKAQFSRSASELAALSKEYDYDLYVYPESVITEADAEKAVVACEDNLVDFIMLQCTSFSAGFVVPVIAKAKAMGLGLWAIPEGVEDGVVPFNSFCSINMYAGILGHYVNEPKLTAKWFFGNKGDPQFDQRYAITIRALSALKKLYNSKVALVGGVAPGFNDLLFDEQKLLALFPGLKLNRLHEFEELSSLAMSFDSDTVDKAVKELASQAVCINPKAGPVMETNARFQLAYRRFVEDNGYDGLAVSCWPKFQSQFKFSVCSVLAGLNEEGTIASCEGDVVSAVCMLLLKYLSNDATTLMDLVAYDTKDESILLWHCGPSPRQFCNSYNLDLNYSGAPHEFGMSNPTGLGVTRDMVFKPGRATIFRLDAALDRNLIISGNFMDGKKKSVTGSRGWMGNLMLGDEKIGALDMTNTLLSKQFPHHYPVVYGDYTSELMELTAWLGLGLVERVDYREYLQR